MRLLRKLCVTVIIFSFVTSALYITTEAGSLAYGAATVSATSLNVRSGPDTTASILLTISHDEKVVILEKTSADWYHIVYNGITGYVASLYLKDVLTAENFDAVGKLTGNDVFLRGGPSTAAGALCTVGSGTTVKVIGINSGWYKVVYDGNTGYIRSDFIALVSDGKTNTAPPAASASATKSVDTSTPPSGSTAQPSPAPSPDQLTLRQQIVAFAKQFVGGSYVYGGQSPSEGFDCSGLVYYVFHHFNYDVTRTASSQYANDGTKIAKSDLLPGDLVFFSSNGGYSVTHVGIYIGDNQFVHASTPKNGILISRLDSDYYTSVWFGAKRIVE